MKNKDCQIKDCHQEAHWKIKVWTPVGKIGVLRCEKHGKEGEAKNAYSLALDATTFFA